MFKIGDQVAFRYLNEILVIGTIAFLVFVGAWSLWGNLS